MNGMSPCPKAPPATVRPSRSPSMLTASWAVFATSAVAPKVSLYHLSLSDVVATLKAGHCHRQGRAPYALT